MIVIKKGELLIQHWFYRRLSFIFNTCNCRFYKILRIDYEFLDAFVVKSDILELLNNTFVLKFKHMQWSFLPKSKN